MKLKNIFLILSIISFVATGVIYPYLPQTIPAIWNFSGEVEQYFHKAYVFLLAALPFLIYMLIWLVPKIEPKRENYKKHKKAFEAVILSVIVVLLVRQWYGILISLNYLSDIHLPMKLAVGLLFIIMGNYMTQIKHNYTFGIKTPWTLASESVWQKTHRVGAYTFFMLGILWVAASFFHHRFVSFVLIALIIAVILFLFVYSYFIYDKERKNKIKNSN